MPKLKLLVVLNDLHSGSSVALMPERFEDHKGNFVGPNAIQNFLWRCWLNARQFVFDIAGDDPFGLVINGDCIEGIHHKTKELISHDIGDHARCFKELIKPIRERAAKCYMVRGTEAHTGNTEFDLAIHLGAEKDPFSGLRIFDKLNLDVNNVPVAVRHHMTTSVRTWTEATGLGAELAHEQLEAARNGEPIPRVLALAHRHRYGTYSSGQEVVVCGGPWQMLTRFGHKVVGAARTKPAVFALDWRGRASGEIPFVHHRIYSAPRPTLITL